MFTSMGPRRYFLGSSDEGWFPNIPAGKRTSFWTTIVGTMKTKTADKKLLVDAFPFHTAFDGPLEYDKVRFGIFLIKCLTVANFSSKQGLREQIEFVSREYNKNCQPFVEKNLEIKEN